MDPLSVFGNSGYKEWTVGEIMDLFISQVPNAPFQTTLDTLKAGTRDQVVIGIVTTMFPTLAVINKAVALKANLIIPHEPTFYSGSDETEWLGFSKIEFLETVGKYGVSIFGETVEDLEKIIRGKNNYFRHIKNLPNQSKVSRIGNLDEKLSLWENSLQDF